jgi:hypothetical protein
MEEFEEESWDEFGSEVDNLAVIESYLLTHQ